jgi:DnaJ-class molecular chaperone
MSVNDLFDERCACGYELNCQCDDDFMDDLDCTHCGGEGEQENDDPLRYGDVWMVPCVACRGTGNRRDQWLF